MVSSKFIQQRNNNKQISLCLCLSLSLHQVPTLSHNYDAILRLESNTNQSQAIVSSTYNGAYMSGQIIASDL